MLKIYNSLTKKTEVFSPIDNINNTVGIYSCGPTVYDYSHIGHGRKYVADNIIARTLRYLGYKVKHVMNITDVGHLVSDADTGEDKLEKGAKKAGKTVWEVAEFFTTDFFKMLELLNISGVDVFCKATEHIPEQINQIEKLFKNGFAYDTTEAVYFNVARFPGYQELFGQNLSEKNVGVRDEVVTDINKKNAQDFVLWFKAVGKYKDHTMRWKSPWGSGFPGWHIECSAMSTRYLGEQFDIHTGGIDHLSIHHPNEIAQAEGASGKHPFVKYWIHHDFLTVDNQKMSKSLGNIFRVSEIKEKGYSPLALRYLYLLAHHSRPLNFTFEALDSAAKSLSKIYNAILNLQNSNMQNALPDPVYCAEFLTAMEDDFNTPVALAVLWKVLKSDLDNSVKLVTILDFDKILGLGLSDIKPSKEEYPQKVRDLITKREIARKEKNWEEADKIREELKREFNVEIKDN